jgi:hypothetical protein
MCGRTPAIVACFVLFALPGFGCAQEAESPLPPWGRTLEAESPADEGRWSRLRGCVRWFREDPESYRGFVRTEYLLSWTKADHAPALVTSGPTTDPTPGAPALPYTQIIDDGNIDFKDRSGFRLTLGATAVGGCLDIEAHYFFLDSRHSRFEADSPGNPIIARPFFDASTGAPDSSLTTYPGIASGSIAIDAQTHLTGTGILGAIELLCREDVRLRGLVGFRYLDLRESLEIRESSTITDTADVHFGQAIGDRDAFHTTNDFYGGELGLDVELRSNTFTTVLFGKCALGAMSERARTDGSTDLFGTVLPGGLFALTSNMGSYSRTRFACVPEAGIRFERAFGPHLLLSAGYSFLYLSGIARPGELIDPYVNLNLVPTSTTFGTGNNPARPAFVWRETDYWAHLFQFGLTVRF